MPGRTLTAAVLGGSILLACTSEPHPAAGPAPSAPATMTTASASPTRLNVPASSSVPSVTTPAASPPAGYGEGPAWPRGSRRPAPPAYGAVRTRRTAATTAGSTLARSLLLPRLDANARSPLVMTPCGRRVRLRAQDVEFVPPGSGGPLPKRASGVLVVIDPGHGGRARGAMGVDGSAEADRVLLLARAVASRLDARVGRVLMTRNRDFEAGLPFRVALADALRADAAVSVHLNADPDGPLARPGVETYGSVADRQGRRLAGVMYETQRRYLETFPGPWVGDTDAGAKYRLGRAGADYYGLLRRAHVPWVISESLFMTSRHDLQLLDDDRFHAGLAGAIADAAVAFTTTRAAGSGWVKPYPRRPNPPEPPAPPGSPRVCVDPVS